MNVPDVRPDGVSVSEAARLLGVSPGTIRRRIAEGTLSAERVIRPQGTAWRVRVPADAPATRNVLPTGTFNGASPSESSHAPVTYAPHVQDAPVIALTESVARLIAELAEVRVISDRRADQLASQSETIGRQAAELNAARAELEALRAQNPALVAPTAAQSVEPSPEPLWPSSRAGRIAYGVALLVAVALILAETLIFRRLGT